LTITDEISRRKITEIVHFTTNKGLVGILAEKTVYSRRRLKGYQYLQYILHPNAKMRPEESDFFNKAADWLDFVNLSISEINRSFFNFSQRWPHNQEILWVILSFDPQILTHEGVYFTTTNNTYEHCQREVGVTGLRGLFANPIRRKGTWRAYRGNRVDRLPTCEQAEVLYPVALPLSFLRRIYVNRAEDADRVRGWLREFEIEGVEVRVEPQKFEGAPN
jgi:ssDNA thymidine ADP-ribosyltransferase, DarT